MRDWLEKRSVKGALVLALIVIWGYNSYSIVGMSSEEETASGYENEIDFDISELTIPDTEHYRYKADFQDPFEPRLKSSVKEKPEPTQEQTREEKTRIPNLKLTGIVEEMALIQNQNRKLFFVSAGDTVEGARIRFVAEDSVGLIVKEKKFTLQFNH